MSIHLRIFESRDHKLRKPPERPFPYASRGETTAWLGWTSVEIHAQKPDIDPVRLYLSHEGGYEGLMEWVAQYAEQSAKFVEYDDESVFHRAKSGDEVALHELIFRAVKKKAGYVAAKTGSIAPKNPDFDPQSVISYCLQNVLGNKNERFDVLARKEALGSISQSEYAELETLSRNRRSVRQARSGLELIEAYRRSMHIAGMLDALES